MDHFVEESGIGMSFPSNLQFFLNNFDKAYIHPSRERDTVLHEQTKRLTSTKIIEVVRILARSVGIRCDPAPPVILLWQ